MNAASDPKNAGRAVVNRKHPCNNRQQHLGGAYVAGRLITADMLLSGLQCHSQRWPSTTVLSDTDEPSRHGAFVLIGCCEECRMRSAISERYTKTLRIADRYISTELTRRRQHGEGQQVGGHGDHRAGFASVGAKIPIVLDISEGRRVLHKRTDYTRLELERSRVSHLYLNSPHFGAGFHDGDGLRVTIFVHQVHRVVDALGRGNSEGHGFGSSSAFIQQRGVGNGEAGQI